MDIHSIPFGEALAKSVFLPHVGVSIVTIQFSFWITGTLIACGRGGSLLPRKRSIGPGFRLRPETKACVFGIT